MLLFDIFYEGTKFSLLLDEDDEESAISLKKQLCHFTLYQQFEYVHCEIDSSQFSHKYFHYIDPKFKHTELLSYSLINKKIPIAPSVLRDLYQQN